MHWQYWPLGVTVPASTPANNPFTIGWPLSQGFLERVEIDIPGGHAGLTAIQVTYMHTVIFPWQLGGFLVPARNYYDVEWGDQIEAVGLRINAFNTDLYPHTFYLRAKIWPDVRGPAAAPAGALFAPPPSPQLLAAVGGMSSIGSAGG